MRRSLPYLLFGAVTLAAFSEFLFLGRTLYDVRSLEIQLLEASPEKDTGAFRRPYSHRDSNRGDTIWLLPSVLDHYNEGLKSFEFRLWNPNLLCGYPLYADPMVHPFYPPHLVLHGLFPSRVAYELTLMLHLFFAGAAMFWLLCALGRSRAGAAVGGLLWMLFGYHALWFSTEVLAGVSVFLPLALLAWTRAQEKKDLLFAGLGGLALGGVILGSHPQHALHAFLFAAIWIVAAAWRGPENRGFLFRAAGLLGAVALGTGLPTILTRLDSITHGFRYTGSDFAVVYANPHLWTHMFGLPLGKIFFLPEHLQRSEFTVYLGFAGTVLAVLGAVRGFREPASRFAAIAGAVLLFVVFATPMAAVLNSIPLLNLSLPSRWVMLVGFCAALLAARGVDALADQPGRIPHTIAGATISYLLAWAVFAFPVWPALETLIGFLLAGAGAVMISRSPRTAYGLCLAALLFDLLPSFLVYNDHRDGEVLDRRPETLASLNDPEGGPPRVTMAVGVKTTEFEIERFAWLLSIRNNVYALYGAESGAGYEAIAPKWTAQYCVEAGGDVGGSGRAVTFGNPGSPLLDAAGVTHVYIPSELSAPGHFTPRGEWGPLRFYENTRAVPRAYLASRVLHAENRTRAGEILRSSEFVPGKTVVLEDAGALAATGTGSVSWVDRRSDRVELDVTADEDALLVLSDSWYPGWEAEIDGRSTTIYRANLAFRAIAVPAGTHRVTFTFRPADPRTGLFGAALALLGVAILAVRRWKIIRARLDSK